MVNPQQVFGGRSIHTDEKSGDPVIARDRVIENQEGLPRINADEKTGP
ncbi:MAG: hypothetical protein ACRD72_00315 [Candidatus Angelobacter sp.]